MAIFSYISCPYCSHSLVLEKFQKTKFPIDPLDFFIMNDREQRSDVGWTKGNAKGSGQVGFFHVEGSEKTIVELSHGTREEKRIAEKIANRIKLIYESYRQAGLI